MIRLIFISWKDLFTFSSFIHRKYNFTKIFKVEINPDRKNATTTRTITGHGQIPFKQEETHYVDDNITKYVVGAHLHYSENTIYKDHSKKVIVAVVEDKCIFIDDTQSDSQLTVEGL